MNFHKMVDKIGITVPLIFTSVAPKRVHLSVSVPLHTLLLSEKQKALFTKCYMKAFS